MKKYLRLFKPKMQMILIVLVATVSSVFAEGNQSNFIIITGQVINTEYGNPVKDHEVYIKSESEALIGNYYYNVLITDESGFFYDTIPTQFTYGKLEVYTFDYTGLKQSEVLHFRFSTHTNSNIFLVNFNIYMPLQMPVLQAKFKYLKKVTGDKLRFKFIDQTESNNIESWHWEFGDGTTSELKDPDHTYADFGMYRVNLRIVAIVNGSEEISTISQYVYIPLINYYHLGGHCYNDQFPIHHGLAVLYKVTDDKVLIPMDTTALNDTLGQYYFYQIPEGNYCVMTQPDKESEYYGLLTPTYYGDTEFWKDATIIKLDHTDFGYHIHLVQSNGVTEGSGKIAGKITFKLTDRNLTGYCSEGITVYLLDELYRPLTYQYTDGNSSFSFDNLAMGTYWIYPEIAGFNLEKERVPLTIGNPVVDNIEFEIDGDAVYLIFPNSENPEDNFVGQPYPNPASNQISFEINTKDSKNLNLYISDLQGRIVVSKTMNLENGLNKNTIETSGLTPGMYVLRMEANGIQQERKIMINR